MSVREIRVPTRRPGEPGEIAVGEIDFGFGLDDGVRSVRRPIDGVVDWCLRHVSSRNPVNGVLLKPQLNFMAKQIETHFN